MITLEILKRRIEEVNKYIEGAHTDTEIKLYAGMKLAYEDLIRTIEWGLA